MEEQISNVLLNTGNEDNPCSFDPRSYERGLPTTNASQEASKACVR